MSLPVAILAGGLATRLGPLTEKLPKSLVDIAGRPFALHQIELLKRHGLTELVFCVGHLGHLVEEALGDGRDYGVRIRYVHDAPRLLGTGGALRRGLPSLGEAFFVLYGDSWLDCDYHAVQRAFEASGKLGLMTVFRNGNRWDSSNVLFREGRIVNYDKKQPGSDMQHIDYGLGVLRAAALEHYPAGEHVDLADVYRHLIARDELAGFEVATRFYEVGSPRGLEELREALGTRSADRAGYARRHLEETSQVVSRLDAAAIERMASLLVDLRRSGGRLFFLGVGGSAANCSHAVNDFRKLAGIEAYTPVDNVSELTARTNDEGWENVFAPWLKASRLSKNDMLFVFSVGGGSLEHNISPNLVLALRYAREVGARVVAVVGRDGGYTARVADACVIVPTVNPDNITPHTEAFQAVVWHLLVSHPLLKVAQTKWESTQGNVVPSSSTGTV